MRILCCCAVALLTCSLSAQVDILSVRGSVLAVKVPKTDPADRVLRNQLSSIRVTLDVSDAPLTDVMDLFRQTTGVNVVVHPGIHADPPAITLSVREMTALTALNWIRRLGSVNTHFIDGAVFVTREPVQREEQLILYDVTDLTHPITNFPGPTLSLNGTSGAEVNALPAFEADEESNWDIEDLAEIIENQLEDKTTTE